MSITGSGGAGANAVGVASTGTVSVTSSGAVAIVGTGGTGSAGNQGVNLNNTQVSATGSGTVSIQASSNGAANAPALVADSSSSLGAASTADNINLTSNNGSSIAGTVTTPGGLLLSGTVTGDFSLTNSANSVARLAATLSGALSFTDARSLTVGTVNATPGITVNGSGATTTLSVAGALIFAANTVSTGTINAMTTETASESTTPLPLPDENLVVNSGVTVESTTGDVNLTAGDDILVHGAIVKSDLGVVTETPGVNDIDKDSIGALAAARNFFVDSAWALRIHLREREVAARRHQHVRQSLVLHPSRRHSHRVGRPHRPPRQSADQTDPGAWDNPELIPGASSRVAANPSQVQAADQARAFFRSSAGDFSQNAFGGQEKWLEGLISAKALANQNNPWYFILPDGSVHEWDGTAHQLTGTLVATITPDVNLYKDPSLLTDAYQNASVNSGGFAATRHFYFDASQGLVRNLWENALGADEKWFAGDPNTFGNRWYFVKPGGDLYEWNGSAAATGNVLAHLGVDAWSNLAPW